MCIVGAIIDRLVWKGKEVMQFINSLKENDKIKCVYLIKEKSIGVAKTGNQFCSLVLQDKTGTLNAKIWDFDNVPDDVKNVHPSQFVLVNGYIKVYNNQNQMTIDAIRVATESEYNQNDYFKISKYDPDKMIKEFDSIISTIKNAHYKKLLEMIFIEDKIFREKFNRHQGGKSVHHSFVHGLLEHSLSVAKLAQKVVTNYEDLNVDLTITAALLHDIGKVYETSDYPKNDYTDEGNLLGHIVMGYNIVSNKIDTIKGVTDEEKTELLHLILSHHGQLEFGSPKLPSIMEALVLSMCDNLDAKLEIMREGIENAKSGNNYEECQFIGYNKFLETNYRETSKP